MGFARKVSPTIVTILHLSLKVQMPIFLPFFGQRRFFSEKLVYTLLSQSTLLTDMQMEMNFQDPSVKPGKKTLQKTTNEPSTRSLKSILSFPIFLLFFRNNIALVHCFRQYLLRLKIVIIINKNVKQNVKQFLVSLMHMRVYLFC